jgi:hypothetical protein
MKGFYTNFFVLLTAVTVGSGSLFAEDLDAALAAQKKKAQRRVYSESALLHDQNLVVPRTVSAEEKALDKELQAKDARLDAQPSSIMQQPMPVRPATATVRPAENQNWLTAAIMDDEASLALTNAADDSWLMKELDRQKELKALEAAGNENALVEKLLREKTQLQSSSPEMERLKQYQLAPPKLFGSTGKDTEASLYTAPRGSTPDPLAAIRLTPRKQTPAPPPLFSPEAARLSSALDKDPLRSTRSAALTPNLGAPVRSSSRSSFSPTWGEPDPVSLTPMEMIKKSSPIHRQDPFKDDHMPKIKSSIWE